MKRNAELPSLLFNEGAPPELQKDRVDSTPDSVLICPSSFIADAVDSGEVTPFFVSTTKTTAGSLTLNTSVRYSNTFAESLLGSEYPPLSSLPNTAEPITPAAKIKAINKENMNFLRLTITEPNLSNMFSSIIN